MNKDGNSGYPAEGYAWYVLFILFLAYVVSFMDRQILSLLIEPIKTDLGLSDTSISLLSGFAFAIFYTFLGIPLGRLADSKNRKIIIVVGITAWSIMTAFCGLARNALMLFIGRIGVAAGEASLAPSAYSMISDYFPREKRGRALSYYSLGIFAGAGVAYIFGGVISAYAAQAVAMDIGFLGTLKAWQLTFMICALPGLIVVAMMFTVKEPTRKEKISTSAGGIPLSQVIEYLKIHWLTYFCLFFATGLAALANYGVLVWVPAYFIRVFEYTPREIGMTFGSILLILGTTSLVTAGWAADKWYQKGRPSAHLDLVIISVAFVLLPSIIFFFVSTPLMAIICLGFIVFGMAVHTGLVPAAIQLITPNEFRGQITAVYLFVLNLIGLGFGPTVVALFTDHVYQDQLMVGKSIALTLIIFLILSVGIYMFGHQSYKIRQQELVKEVS